MSTHSSRQKWAPLPCESYFTLLLRPALVLHFSPTAGTPALLLSFSQHFNCSLTQSPAEILETTGCNEENPSKIIPCFDECTTLTEATYVTHHSYILKLLPLPTSRITTLTWKFLNSAGKIKCRCYLPCSNDDFCSIQHYLTFSLSFTLKQGCFKKF